MTLSEKFQTDYVSGELFRNCSNMALIGAKICQNAFQTIPNVSFFDATEKNPLNVWIEFFYLRQFGVILEEPRINGLQNQLPCQILV